jgi:NitT/TauT family transport system ATP-binding protein
MSTSSTDGASRAEGVPAIQITGVTRRFLTAEGQFNTAMHDFSLTVKRGEFVCVVGPTGCGKSTTLNLVTGLISPSAGQVRVMGQPVVGIDRRVGFVFQSDALFPWRSVLDNVAAGPRYRGVPKAEANEKARMWVARVGLGAYESLYPHQLSGGMRKRVALAQTFINEPEILLLDEPFSALDVQTRTVMQDELLRLWAGTGASVVFVTHDLEEAVALADQVVVLTASPATVKKVHTIDLPRPRVMSEIRYEPAFIEIAKRIWDDLRDEVTLGQRGALDRSPTPAAH